MAYYPSRRAAGESLRAEGEAESMSGSQAGAEWRQYWTLPIAAALGYATCVIHIYGLGVFIEPVAREFGWSRTEVTVGLTLSTAAQALAAIPIGIMVDRIGPRRLAIIGILLTCAAFANIGLASGTMANWYVTWAIMSVASLPIQATVWTSAVASRFSASRGLALATALCGASVALIVFPWLGAELIERYGWRQAMRIEALVWLVVAWPVVLLFFRGAHDGGAAKSAATASDAPAAPLQVADVSLRDGLRSSVFLRLLFAALLFTFTMIGLNVHFPLMLKAYGYSPVAAAATASLIGFSSIFGRLGTGMMLDRYRGSIVGAVAFSMPALACAVLLADGSGSMGASIAALLIGFTLGAEIDVLVFLTTRYFGLRNFGALYGGILSALSVGTAFGPLAAANVFDRWGSYDPFLWLTIGAMLASSVALATLPPPPNPLRKVSGHG